MPHLHKPRTNPHKQHTILLVLHAKLRNDEIHSRLRRAVQRPNVNIDLVSQVKVGHTRRNGNDAFRLRLALEHKRHEVVEKVHVADDVCLKQLGCDLVELVGLAGSIKTHGISKLCHTDGDGSSSSGEKANLQIANWCEAIEIGYESAIGKQHVDAAVTYYLGGFFSGLLQGGVGGEVYVEDVDV